jgi:hypothetical protein
MRAVNQLSNRNTLAPSEYLRLPEMSKTRNELGMRATRGAGATTTIQPIGR